MAKEKYNKYKKSTVSWLGDIPEHWEIRRIKYVFQELDQRSETGKEDLLSVSQYTGVTKKSDKVAEGESVTNAKTLKGYKIVEKGNLVINIMLAWNGSLGISKYNGIVSPAYCVYKNLIGDERYFGYLFKTKNAKQEFKKQSTGIINSRLRMYTDSFFNIKTALPPKQEQTAIANFLDYKIEKINRFITKKKQLIEFLNEKKTAIINEMVTGKKVWNGNTWTEPAKVKDSGIEWLGDIPVHWEVRKLKYYASHNDEALTNSTNKDYKLKYIDIGNVGSDGGIDEIVEYKFSEAPSRARRIVKKGDVIISTVRTYLKAIVKIENDKDIIVSTGFAVLRPKSNVSSTFLYSVVRANYFIEEVCANSFGVSYPAINASELVTLKLAVPSTVQEQDEIYNYIEAETQKINKTIATIEKEISLVEEYKTALIAEAVTGKIDVRDFQLPTTETPLAMVAEEAANYNKR